MTVLPCRMRLPCWMPRPRSPRSSPPAPHHTIVKTVTHEHIRRASQNPPLRRPNGSTNSAVGFLTVAHWHFPRTNPLGRIVGLPDKLFAVPPCSVGALIG